MKPATVYLDDQTGLFHVSYVSYHSREQRDVELEADNLLDAIDEAQTVTDYRIDEIDY
jgi:hypothetical protein